MYGNKVEIDPTRYPYTVVGDGEYYRLLHVPSQDVMKYAFEDGLMARNVAHVMNTSPKGGPDAIRTALYDMLHKGEVTADFLEAELKRLEVD